jgi:hypothetical protein
MRAGALWRNPSTKVEKAGFTAEAQSRQSSEYF